MCRREKIECCRHCLQIYGKATPRKPSCCGHDRAQGCLPTACFLDVSHVKKMIEDRRISVTSESCGRRDMKIPRVPCLLSPSVTSVNEVVIPTDCLMTRPSFSASQQQLPKLNWLFETYICQEKRKPAFTHRVFKPTTCKRDRRLRLKAYCLTFDRGSLRLYPCQVSSSQSEH